MEAGGEVEVGAHQLEQLGPKPPCEPRVSITDDGLRHAPILEFFRNRRAASSAVQSVGAAMKVAYLENRSTTTIMEPNLRI